MASKKNMSIKKQNRRMDKILYPIIFAMFVIIMIIYGQNIYTQWNIISEDYTQNQKMATDMSENMAGNLNLASRMFDEQAIESANDVLDEIQEYYNNNEDILTIDLSKFLTPVQDLWLDINILDTEYILLNEKEAVSEDTYKLNDIKGARNLANELIKRQELRENWITISTQTDMIIKYIYVITDDQKYAIEIAANIMKYNTNIDVYDIESYANDLVRNFDFVDSAYVFNTQGLSTSNIDSDSPQFITDELENIFNKTLAVKAAVEITNKSKLGYSDTMWAVPVNVSNEDEENVFYNYILLVKFDNYETMNYFYAQAAINLFISILAMVIILMMILRNSSQYLSPLSNLSSSIKAASLEDYDKIVKIKGAKSMKKTIREYNGLLSVIKDAIKRKDNAYFQTINALVSAIDASDKYTGGHCNRVMQISVAVGKKINLSKEDLEILKYGALLHDIGKIGIDNHIVNKKGRLTDKEYIEIKTHPSIGIHIISNIEYLSKAKVILDEHHEKYDGTGYPHGLKGEEISILARIVTLADAYDAMNSDRSYRKKMDKEVILEEIRKNAGKQFDPELVPIFIEVEEEEIDL